MLLSLGTTYRRVEILADRRHTTRKRNYGANSKRRRMRHLPGCAHKSSCIALSPQVLLRVLEWLAIKIRMGGAKPGEQKMEERKCPLCRGKNPPSKEMLSQLNFWRNRKSELEARGDDISSENYRLPYLKLTGWKVKLEIGPKQ